MRSRARSERLRRRWPLVALAALLLVTHLPKMLAAAQTSLASAALNRAQLDTARPAAGRAGAYTTAAAHAVRALRLVPDAARPYATLGAIYLDLGDAPAAAQAYAEAVRRDPDDRMAQFAYGQALAALGEETAAREAWSAARAAGYFAHRAHELTKDDPDAALLNAERAYQLAPEAPESVLVLGDALVAQGLVTEALTFYEAALARIPDAADVHREAGILYDRLGRTDEAIPALERAIALAPRAPVLGAPTGVAARLALARILAARGACYEAASWLAPLFSRVPVRSHERTAHLLVGRCHLDHARPLTAIPYLAALTSAPAPQARDWLLLGQAYEAGGEPVRARAAYEAALAADPNYRAAELALVQLLERTP